MPTTHDGYFLNTDWEGEYILGPGLDLQCERPNAPSLWAVPIEY